MYEKTLAKPPSSNHACLCCHIIVVCIGPLLSEMCRILYMDSTVRFLTMPFDQGPLIENFTPIYCFAFHRILMFEEKMKEEEKPSGVAPKKSLADLP